MRMGTGDPTIRNVCLRLTLRLPGAVVSDMTPVATPAREWTIKMSLT